MKKYLLILALSGLAVSCNSKLDIAPPSNITEEQIMDIVKEDLPTVVTPMANGLQTNIAVSKKNEVRYSNYSCYHLIQNLRGNDMVFASLVQSWNRDEYRFLNYRTAASDKNVLYWQYLYEDVGKANKVFDMLKKGEWDETWKPEWDQDAKKYEKEITKWNALATAKAIALAARAYCYTYLMWIYADDYLIGPGKQGVPWKTTYDVWGEPTPRSTAEVVWTNTLKDIEDAIALFEKAVPSDKYYTSATEDFDLNVMNALRMRIAISMGKWDKVIESADAILNEGGFAGKFLKEAAYIGDVDGDGKPDYKNTAFTNASSNPERILSFANTRDIAGTGWGGWMNIFGNGGYGGSGTGYMAIDKRLYDQIGDGDYRKKNFLAQEWSNYYYPQGKSVQNIPQYANTKFGARLDYKSDKDNVANTQFDQIFIRLSEIVLLKAEALYRSGDASNAATTLQDLTAARGAAPVTESGEALWKRIQLEWRIEMWGENGWEYYNNKRWGLGVDRSGDVSVTNHTDHSVVPAGTAFTWQIPEREIMFNPMEQNP